MGRELSGRRKFVLLMQSTLHTEPEIMVGTWLGECCRQVETEEVSNSRNKIHQTTYKDFFRALYIIPMYTSLRPRRNFLLLILLVEMVVNH